MRMQLSQPLGTIFTTVSQNVSTSRERTHFATVAKWVNRKNTC